jgi:hypothetical protein
MWRMPGRPVLCVDRCLTETGAGAHIRMSACREGSRTPIQQCLFAFLPAPGIDTRETWAVARRHLGNFLKRNRRSYR